MKRDVLQKDSISTIEDEYDALIHRIASAQGSMLLLGY